MTYRTTRRAVLIGGALFAAASMMPAFAQDTPSWRFSAVFSEQDIRADMMKMIAEDVSDIVNLELHYGGTLMKQGTELVGLQRNNLQMSNIAPQDISKQIPEWSVLTSAYLFRDPEHLKAFFASDVGAEFKKMAEDQLNIHILGPTYYGTRQVGLRIDKEIQTPADMAGIKLRMPGGEAWQFLGTALGANPTPMAYAEVYTGLQTGAIDGQDNPLPNVDNMKFYEVMDQIVLTSHLVAFDLLTVAADAWNALSDEEKQQVQAAADEALEWSAQQHTEQANQLAEKFEQAGLKVYTPDVDAFREHAQKLYLESELAKEWPEGVVDRINAL